LNAKRIAFGIGLGTAFTAAGIFLLAKVAIPAKRTFQGKSPDEWRQELNGGDVRARDNAQVVLKTIIIPELTDAALHDTNDSGFKLAVASALNNLPGVRISYLTAPGRRGAALNELGRFGPFAEPAVPVLIQLLHDKNEAIRAAAADALGDILSDPAVAIPALIACLDDPDIDDAAAEALGKFGPLAKAAVPKMLPLLHGGKEARRAAKLALPKIDPEAASQAGIKSAKKKP